MSFGVDDGTGDGIDVAAVAAAADNDAGLWEVWVRGLAGRGCLQTRECWVHETKIAA